MQTGPGGMMDLNPGLACCKTTVVANTQLYCSKKMNGWVDRKKSRAAGGLASIAALLQEERKGTN